MKHLKDWLEVGLFLLASLALALCIAAHGHEPQIIDTRTECEIYPRTCVPLGVEN